MVVYDFAIIGSGMSGMAAAIYSARFGMKTLLIGKETGGLIQYTHVVENYPGIKSISGPDLAKAFVDHVKAYPVNMIDETVESLKKGKNFSIKTNKNSYTAKTVLLATGGEHRKLPAKGALEFENRGVSYCALCDGPLYPNKIVGVVGGSDSAAKESLLLSKHAKKVYIIYRKAKIRAEPINLERVNKNKKIEIIPNTNIVEVVGDKFMTHVVLDKPYKGSKTFKLDALFVEIGHIPATQLAKQVGARLNQKGEVIIDKDSNTNVSGFYAAGDCTNRAFKQAITGVAEGVVAANSANDYVKGN